MREKEREEIARVDRNGEYRAGRILLYERNKMKGKKDEMVLISWLVWCLILDARADRPIYIYIRSAVHLATIWEILSKLSLMIESFTFFTRYPRKIHETLQLINEFGNKLQQPPPLPRPSTLYRRFFSNQLSWEKVNLLRKTFISYWILKAE